MQVLPARWHGLVCLSWRYWALHAVMGPLHRCRCGQHACLITVYMPCRALSMHFQACVLLGGALTSTVFQRHSAAFLCRIEVLDLRNCGGSTLLSWWVLSGLYSWQVLLFQHALSTQPQHLFLRGMGGAAHRLQVAGSLCVGIRFVPGQSKPLSGSAQAHVGWPGICPANLERYCLCSWNALTAHFQCASRQ